MDGNPKSGIEGDILDIFHILRLAPGTVLRAEDGDDPGAGRLQQIECVTQLGIDAGGMAHHPDPGAANFFGIVADQYFQASLDTRHRGDRSSVVSGASILALRNQLS